MAILVRGIIPEKSFHCCSLQPTLTWQFQSGGGNSSKVFPLQPNSYIILPPLNKLPPTLLHQFTPHRQITPPPLLQRNGRILGRTFDPGVQYMLPWTCFITTLLKFIHYALLSVYSIYIIIFSFTIETKTNPNSTRCRDPNIIFAIKGQKTILTRC